MHCPCVLLSDLGQIGARGRGAALDMHSGRLRGGFRASALPGVVTPRCPVPSTEETVTTLQASGSTIRVECDEDLVTALNSITTICRTVQAEMKSFDQRLSRVEQKQSCVGDAVKELTAMLKKQMESFTVKGSNFEVSYIITQV